MKKIKYILLLSIIFFACSEEEFLNEVPISSLSVKSFFKTSQQFEEAVTGAYTNLRPLYSPGGSGGIGGWEGSAWSFAEVRSDNTTCQYNRIDQSAYDWWDLDQFLMASQNRILTPAWNNCYSGIGKCNTILYYIDEVEVDNKVRYVSEAKFLRAYYYFHLVRYFENIPLVTQKVETMEQAFELNEQVPKDQIYNQIVSDLNDAKTNLPKNYSGKDIGRATEGAARTLLAKVLMWRGQYGDAAIELEAVVSSNQYSLLDDYSSVFDINNENNEEIIFSIQFIEGPHGLGSVFMYSFLPYNSDRKYLPLQQNTARTGLNIPTEDLINSFEEGDDRKEMIDFSFIDPETAVYHDSIVPFTKKFMDHGHSQRLITGRDFPVFRYSHVLLMLAECYLREGSGDPLTLVNEVRNRAKLSNLTNVTLDDIIHERRVEFHCEADRWDVLVRTGIAKEVMQAHGETQKGLPNVAAKAYGNIKLYFPIPSSVIELDPKIEQNSEYK
jgi:starch-binding outer membrane protein, SusD/RagB family